jgi:transposase-like protein
VQALARELDIERALLYRWQRHYLRGGAAALRNTGRPRPALMQPSENAEPAEAGQAPAVAANPALAPAADEQSCSPVAPPVSLAAHDPAAAARRIAELERKIGQQQLELDFFRAALRHVKELRR